MGDANADLTAGVQPRLEATGRNSPVSASDHTPRSEVPSGSVDAVIAGQPLPDFEAEPSYFSPQPLRPYSSNLPRSDSASTDPPPTSIVNASATPVHATESPRALSIDHPSPAGQLDRPIFQRDHSSASTGSVATVRANSVDPISIYTSSLKQLRDGPTYPNQAYSALHYQQYPPPHVPHILRTRSSHPVHFSGHSISNIPGFGLSDGSHRDIMESGSRTVGNSPASSPGLFSPETPPLRHKELPEDGSYSTPWLHYTHRQAPKETHIADVDVDPISGRKIINQYEVIDELGRGVHGKVKLGRNLETGVFVAIKIVDRYSKRRRLGKNTSHEDKIKREIAILKKARHPNIVSLLEVIDDPAKKKVYIVLEHVELGEVKWRIEGAKEVCLVEWRRYQRESAGIFDNDNATMEDEKILKLAHQKLEQQHRQRNRKSYLRRKSTVGNEHWSFEHGGASEDEYSETGRSSRALGHSEDRHAGRPEFMQRQDVGSHYESNMETAYRSTTPTATIRPDEDYLLTELEGTMYGAYNTELFKGRTPSLAGSNSSHFTDGEDEVPEHFHYVPLMTIDAARETFRDTVLGLEYLHFQGVIHRDIKPANLLQTKEHRIKMSDFGVSYLGRPKAEESSGDHSESDVPDADEAVELAKTVGTPAFYAPELCNTEVDADPHPVTNKIDIWALGVTLYCLVYGRVPFHEHNTFVLMKIISETEPYIPRYRLKAVAEPAGSRPSSHGRGYPTTAHKRAPHDLEYEEVDENLRDLLKKLLVKDVRKRIPIKEIKRHPWLLDGLDTAWVEETDPDRSSQGRRIEISKDDLEMAVVPITLIDRVRSGVKKGIDLVQGGLKTFTRGGSRPRRRAQSSATSPDPTHNISAHSSSSTVSQEGRRPSLAINQSIFEALSRSRESDHPLSQSVTASPEAKERFKAFESPSSRTASPALSMEGNEYLAPLTALSRPLAPDRASSTISSGSSLRTIRPSDLAQTGRSVSPGIPLVLPGTPTALDTPGGSNLGGIFGGVPRRFVNSVRSRERLLKPSREHHRAKSIDRLNSSDDDPHGTPSIAISTAMASGEVDQPDILKELSPTHVRAPSPNYADFQTSDPLGRASSRQSSVSSISSRLHKSWATQNDLEMGPTMNMGPKSPPSFARDTSDDRFSRAKDEFVRRRVREEHIHRDQPHSATFQRPLPVGQPACPPSPDDETYFQRQKVEDFLNQQHHEHPPPRDSSALDQPISLSSAGPGPLNSSSSEDHFASMSQSTSNPSIPSVASVISASSSMALDDCFHMRIVPVVGTTASADSLHHNQFDAPTDDPAGYDGDHAIDSDEDDDSEEEYLTMGSKKPPHSARSASVSVAQQARNDLRKEVVSHRRRSARSGSNGTVKKIRPSGESDDEKIVEPQ
ncbi:hypothetical protein BDV95DRAFT_628192 [Massariosphaeria phaeospora]|uniref:non-specific serine/threonine protein kinase n=1 Tax=Massariosphaeria phaeospora TaxID=100035 RepID=A0A7C8IAZ2_9PLEO|nr:hypothetical protein BDV95DRAFT_628192 [Massariosphaeria phaeospora]